MIHRSRSITANFTVVLVLSVGCTDDFPMEPERPSEIGQPVTSLWPDSLPLNKGPGDQLGIDTLEIAISSRGLSVSGIDVEWETSDPDVLEVNELTVSSTDLRESLPIQLRAEVRAVSRGAATITVRVLGGRGIEAAEHTDSITVLERWSVVSAGGSHSCGIASDGFAYCLGNGRHGELGNGQFGESDGPVAVMGDLKFREVTAGNMHTCGLDQAGFLHCWGLNLAGQLGDGTTISRTRPAQVSFGQSFVTADAGMGVTCGIASDGFTYCWGSIDYGIDGYIPVFGAVPSIDCPLDDAGFLFDPEQFVAPGGERCAVRPTLPVYVMESGVSWIKRGGFTQLSVGREHACAVGKPFTFGQAVLGTAQCWGLNTTEQIGADSLTPLEPILPNLYELWCNRALGRRLGLEGIRCIRPPENVLGSHDFTQISAGLDGPSWDFFFPASTGVAHSCGLTSAGQIYCWGANDFGELGSATANAATCRFDEAFLRYSPADSPPFPGAGSIRSVSCATRPSLVDPPQGEPVTWKSVSAGWRHTCGLTDKNLAFCWGANEVGQLGTGSVEGALPTAVSGGLRFQSLSAGANHTCAITTPDEALYCWGESFGTAPVRIRDPDPSTS